MKNANLPNSSNSLSSDYDDYSSSVRRVMVPIRELDFESRVMFNAKLPKKKPFSDQLRKNDFVVDLSNYKVVHAGTNSSHNQQILKTLRHCFNQEDNNSESISYNLNEINQSDLTMANHDSKNLNECKHNSVGNLTQKSGENSNSKFTPVSGSRHHHILSSGSRTKLDKTDSMMMTTILSKDCKIANTLAKTNPNSLNKTVNYINSNLDWKRHQESTNFPNPNEHINDTQDSLPNQANADPNESLLGQQKSTKTTTFDESNNQTKSKSNNRIMNGNKSRNFKYRIWQCKIYNYLERPRGWKSGLYHILIFATVFLCLILSVLATIPQYEETASNVLMQTEMVIVVWLSIELTLRVWSAGCRSRYQAWKGRLKFMGNIFCILDLTVIVASITLTVIANSQNKHKNFAAAAFRGLRFFQILRMLRVDRRAGTWRLLGTVVWAHRQELITTFYIGFLSLISSSFIMYLLEKDAHGTKICTFADSLWWGVITLCTIGYGDVYPVTWAGKVLASSVALIGISFFALPAGILGSGFALKVQAMQRQKHLNRRRAPAARLIQCLWRCYAADPNSMSVATWKIHQKALANQHQSILPSLSQPPNIPEYSIANLAKPYISNNSFLNRVTSLKRRTPPLAEKPFNENKSYIKTNSLVQLPYTGSNVEILQTRRDAIVIPGLFNSQTSVYTYNAPNSQVSSPSPETLNPESDSPTNDYQHTGNRSNDSFVIALHQVSSRSKNEHAKVAPIKSSFAHRTLNFFSEFNSNYKSENEELIGSDGHRTSHGNHQNSKSQLSIQQKNVIRAIRKINYFVARRKFKEALRPYDVTDVIEQYSAGNLDMLARIKTLQFRLDKILGSTKSKDCYDSCSVSLATRVVKIERQMDDIGSKFDKFLTAYSVDMKLLMDNSGKNFYHKDKFMFRTGSNEPSVIPSVINDKKNFDRRAKAVLARSSVGEGIYLDTTVPNFQDEETTSEDEELSNEDKIRLGKLRQQQEAISKQINDTLKNLRKNKIIFDQELSNDHKSFWYNDSMGQRVFFDPKFKKSNLKHHDNNQLANSIDRLYKLSKSDSSKNFSKKTKKLKAMMKKYLLNSIRDKSLIYSQVRFKKFKSDTHLNRVASRQKRSSFNARVNLNPIELRDNDFENIKKRVQISHNLFLIEPSKDFECSIADENECAAENSNKSSSSTSIGEKENII